MPCNPQELKHVPLSLCSMRKKWKSCRAGGHENIRRARAFTNVAMRPAWRMCCFPARFAWSPSTKINRKWMSMNRAMATLTEIRVDAGSNGSRGERGRNGRKRMP